MNMNRIIGTTTLALATALVGCGDDSDPASVGVFVDSPVVNIGYETETQSGVTNDRGEYRYLPGETVVFSIGDLQLPPVLADGVVTPLDLAGTTDTGDQVVVNIIRLLQTLDQDGDPENGITITEAAKTAAMVQVAFDVAPATFAADEDVLDLVEAGGQDVLTTELVAEQEALDHFEDQLDLLAGLGPIDGTWVARGFPGTLVVVFMEDGTYVHFELEGGQDDGMEWGEWSLDSESRRLTAGQIFDGNPGLGLEDFEPGETAPFLYVHATADELTATIDENGDQQIDDTLVFDRAGDDGFAGTWLGTGETPDLLMLVLFDDGTYLHGEVENGDPDSGMEAGSYSIAAVTGALTSSQTFDGNAGMGLSDFTVGSAPPFGYVGLDEVDGNTLTAEIDDDGNQTIDGTIVFERL